MNFSLIRVPLRAASSKLDIALVFRRFEFAPPIKPIWKRGWEALAGWGRRMIVVGAPNDASRRSGLGFSRRITPAR